MHANVTRVIDAAQRAGLAISVERFPEGTRTAEDAARAVGCEIGQIVKSLVFMSDAEPILALVSGANRVDVEKLSAALGGTSIRRATGDEARAATGFAIGGVPPIGHSGALTTVLDRDLMDYDRVWAAAGLPDAVFAIAPDDLVRVTSAPTVDLADDSHA